MAGRYVRRIEPAHARRRGDDDLLRGPPQVCSLHLHRHLLPVHDQAV